MKGKLDIDAVFRGTFQDGSTIFMRFVLVALLLSYINVYVNYLMPAGIDPLDMNAVMMQSLIGMLVSFMVSLAELLLAWGLIRQLPLAELPVEFLKRLPYFIIAAVLYTLIVMAGMILLVIPGLILAVTLSQTMVLVVIRNTNPFTALGRSHNLVWGNAWRVFGSMLLFGLMMILPGALLFALPGVDLESFEALSKGELQQNSAMFWAVTGFSTVIAPFYTSFTLNLYWELLKTESPETAANPMTAPDDFTA